MEEKVRSYIERFDMIRQGDVVAAGVSGGADSVCLLLLLAGLREEIGFSLAVIHVEHGIRGEESLSDAAFTERLCRELEIPVRLLSVDVPRFAKESGMSEEEAARELRYGCFLKACEEISADRLALAHHADDCAETLLFRLARGTGIRGMGGIRPVSERDGITVIRPLLCLTRAEIEDWLAVRGRDYRTDSTNADERYARNRIRERVIPELNRINPQAVLHMQSLSAQMADICDYLDEAASRAGSGAFSAEEGEGVALSCEKFGEIPPVLRSHLMLQLIGIAGGSVKDVTALHVERAEGLLNAGVGTRLSLPHGVVAERTYGEILLRKVPPAGEECPADEDILPETVLEIPGETAAGNGLVFTAEVIPVTDISKKIPEKSYTKWFDYDKIKFAVHLRTRRPGDYFQTDASGGHKKLKKYFIDEKVSASARDRVCLLADGDHIMWVVGYRISEAYKVGRGTERILCVSVHSIQEKEKTDGR